MNELKAIGIHTTRWKIETEEEYNLSIMADESYECKKLYLNYYKTNDPSYFTKGIQMAKEKIALHGGGINGLTEDWIVEDMIYCLHRFGFSYDEYFWYKLYNLNTHGKDSFISDKMRFEYYMQLNTKEGNELLRDKYRTYERLKPYYKRDCCAVYSICDRTTFDNFLKNYDSFFYKPLASDSAKGCCTLKSKDIDFEKLLLNGPFVAEEIIEQSGEFADFYPQAVNLIRIPILTTKDGTTHLMGPFLTFGQNDMKAVNAGAGGIIAPIDPTTGVVIGNGWVEKNEVEYIYHPQSHKRIIGYQIPDWSSAINICKEASKLIPECKYIGFDLAQTKKGWVIIEANCYGQFLGQKNSKGLKKEILDLLKDI